jgi:hypothetical protein
VVLAILQLESVSQVSIAATIVLHCVFKKLVNRKRDGHCRQIARLHLHYLVPSVSAKKQKHALPLRGGTGNIKNAACCSWS